MARVLITGSKDFDDYQLLKTICENYISNLENDITIISGGAKGVDRLGEKFAREEHYFIKQFFPNWDKYGKSAIAKRNEDMIKYTAKENGHLIVFWDGKSKGIQNMINLAKDYNLGIRIVKYVKGKD